MINAKRRKTVDVFLDTVFKYDFTKCRNDWSNIAVVGAHGRLYNHSSVKISAIKHTPMLPVKFNLFLSNTLIQRTCLTSCISLYTLQIIQLLKMILKSDPHFPKMLVLFASMKVFKIGEKFCLFHLKSLFCSSDI